MLTQGEIASLINTFVKFVQLQRSRGRLGSIADRAEHQEQIESAHSLVARRRVTQTGIIPLQYI